MKQIKSAEKPILEESPNIMCAIDTKPCTETNMCKAFIFSVNTKENIEMELLSIKYDYCIPF